MLQVSRSGYYRRLAGTEAHEVRQTVDDALIKEIRERSTPVKAGRTE
ncbi:hypothetical protein [Streptomyces sp. NPDC056983]